MRYIDVDFDESDTMTIGEVRAAVVRVMVEQEEMDDADAAELANDVIRSVLNHREREWRAGDVVRDVHSILWERIGTGWRKMGHGGTYPHSRPTRPLTLLDSPKDKADFERGLASLNRARDNGAPI